MSLINKVLQDLDSRSTTRGQSSAITKSVHRGLRPATNTFGNTRPLLPLVALVLVTIILAYGGFSAMVTPLPFWTEMLIATGLKQEPVPVVISETIIIDKKAEPVAKEKSADNAEAEVSQQGKSNKIVSHAVTVPVKRKKIKKRKGLDNKRTRISNKKAGTKRAARRTASSRQAGTIKKREKPVSLADKAENAFRRGSIAMEQGNRLVAEREFRNALALNKKHIQAAELLAGVLISSGRNRDGIRVIEGTLKLTPEITRLSNLLARLYVDQGQERDAIAVLEKAQKQNPGSAHLMSFRAALYQRSGRYADAAKAYRDALTVGPNEGKWWVGLGISLEAQKDWPGARTAYEKAQHANLSPQLAQYAQQRLNVIKTSE